MCSRLIQRLGVSPGKVDRRCEKEVVQAGQPRAWLVLGGERLAEGVANDVGRGVDMSVGKEESSGLEEKSKCQRGGGEAHTLARGHGGHQSERLYDIFNSPSSL
jgi:hypothetical protein